MYNFFFFINFLEFKMLEKIENKIQDTNVSKKFKICYIHFFKLLEHIYITKKFIFKFFKT